MWKSVTEASFKEQNITTPSDIMAKFNIVKTFRLLYECMRCAYLYKLTDIID